MARTHAERRQRRRAKRVVRTVLVVVAALVVLFYLAGGWYFSGQIESTALHVKPGTVTFDLRVTTVTTDSITLSEKSTHDALHAAQIYGLQWDGGYGQLSGAASIDGKQVTRHFTLLSGTPPAAGNSAGLARDAFPDDPSIALGQSVTPVEYASTVGKIPAWFVAGSSDTWAILVHGWTASRTEMLRMMRVTVQAGLPSLDISYRNDKGAPADPSHRYQFGRTEWHDLDAAVQYAQSHGAHAVVLIGASMGGGIVASFMQHSSRAAIVTALVLDAPMLSLSRAVNLAASRKSLPLLGLRVPYSLTWTAKQIAAARYDINWSSVDYLRDTSWDRVPTLLFHGDADTRVPISGSKALARAKPDRVTFVIVHDAAHLECWNRDASRYDNMLGEFVRSHA